MKTPLSINKDTLTRLYNWFLATWLILLVMVVGVVFVLLTFKALYPVLEPEYIKEGEVKVQELDVRFDTKLINELSATKQPSELKASGGRDPFSGY